MNSDAHVQAVLDLLEAAAAGTNLTVHEGLAPNLQDTPYWMVYPEGPGVAHRGERDGAARLAGTSVALDLVVQITSVGGSAWQARWAAAKAQEALLDVVPTVAGRTCRPIVQAFATGRPEPDVTDPDLFTSMAGYRIRSVPA